MWRKFTRYPLKKKRKRGIERQSLDNAKRKVLLSYERFLLLLLSEMERIEDKL